MNEEFLFAVDFKKNEVIVSSSSRGPRQVKFIERIKKEDDILLFNAALTLNSISESSDFDIKLFKMMDKVCQAIYKKNKDKRL